MRYDEVDGLYGPKTRDFVADALDREAARVARLSARTTEIVRESEGQRGGESRVRRVRVSDEADRIYRGPENPARPSSEAEGRVLMYEGEDVRRGALELARIRFMEADGILPALFDFEDSVDVAIRGSLTALSEDDPIFWHVRAINAPPSSVEEPEEEDEESMPTWVPLLFAVAAIVGLLLGLWVRYGL